MEDFSSGGDTCALVSMIIQRFLGSAYCAYIELYCRRITSIFS